MAHDDPGCDCYHEYSHDDVRQPAFEDFCVHAWIARERRADYREPNNSARECLLVNNLDNRPHYEGQRVLVAERDDLELQVIGFGEG